MAFHVNPRFRHFETNRVISDSWRNFTGQQHYHHHNRKFNFPLFQLKGCGRPFLGSRWIPPYANSFESERRYYKPYPSRFRPPKYHFSPSHGLSAHEQQFNPYYWPGSYHNFYQPFREAPWQDSSGDFTFVRKDYVKETEWQRYGHEEVHRDSVDTRDCMSSTDFGFGKNENSLESKDISVQNNDPSFLCISKVESLNGLYHDDFIAGEVSKVEGNSDTVTNHEELQSVNSLDKQSRYEEIFCNIQHADARLSSQTCDCQSYIAHHEDLKESPNINFETQKANLTNDLNQTQIHSLTISIGSQHKQLLSESDLFMKEQEHFTDSEIEQQEVHNLQFTDELAYVEHSQRKEFFNLLGSNHNISVCIPESLVSVNVEMDVDCNNNDDQSENNVAPLRSEIFPKDKIMNYNISLKMSEDIDLIEGVEVIQQTCENEGNRQVLDKGILICHSDGIDDLEGVEVIQQTCENEGNRQELDKGILICHSDGIDDSLLNGADSSGEEKKKELGFIKQEGLLPKVTEGSETELLTLASKDDISSKFSCKDCCATNGNNLFPCIKIVQFKGDALPCWKFVNVDILPKKYIKDGIVVLDIIPLKYRMNHESNNKRDKTQLCSNMYAEKQMYETQKSSKNKKGIVSKKSISRKEKYRTINKEKYRGTLKVCLKRLKTSKDREKRETFKEEKLLADFRCGLLQEVACTLNLAILRSTRSRAIQVCELLLKIFNSAEISVKELFFGVYWCPYLTDKVSDIDSSGFLSTINVVSDEQQKGQNLKIFGDSANSALSKRTKSYTCSKSKETSTLNEAFIFSQPSSPEALQCKSAFHSVHHSSESHNEEFYSSAECISDSGTTTSLVLKQSIYSDGEDPLISAWLKDWERVLCLQDDMKPETSMNQPDQSSDVQSSNNYEKCGIFMQFPTPNKNDITEEESNQFNNCETNFEEAGSTAAHSTENLNALKSLFYPSVVGHSVQVKRYRSSDEKSLSHRDTLIVHQRSSEVSSSHSIIDSSLKSDISKQSLSFKGCSSSHLTSSMSSPSLLSSHLRHSLQGTETRSKRKKSVCKSCFMSKDHHKFGKCMFKNFIGVPENCPVYIDPDYQLHQLTPSNITQDDTNALQQIVEQCDVTLYTPKTRRPDPRLEDGSPYLHK